MYFIVRGLATRARLGEGHKKWRPGSLTTLTDTDFVGEDAMLDESAVAQTTVTALTYVNTMVLARSDFENLIEALPDGSQARSTQPLA